MGKFGNICLLLGLVTYLYYYAVVEAVDCSTGAGYCNYYSNYLRCYITNNETQGIKSLLSYCSGQSTVFYTIYVYKNYVSTVYGNLIIDIELASNIQYLYIYNYGDKDNIRLTTSSQNTGLTRIYSKYHIQLEAKNFFNYFTGLKYIYLSYCITKETPSFTNLQYLSFLSVRIVGASTRTFDNTIVRELSNLVHISFYNSDFSSITKGALDGLNSLTFLSFGDNKLHIIEDGTFSELSSLSRLYLHNNGIKIISNNVFEGLTELTYLNLDENPGFPIEALIHTRSLRDVYIRYNDYHTLDPYVFQQMKSPSSIYIYVNDPFICDCRLQWTSMVSQYGVYINYGYCSEPNVFFQKSITNPQLYANCSQTESYQCFDKLITCPSNQVCHNTQDGYFCGCPIGYLHSSGECVDEDECDVVTECEHTCENTEGSYHCVCDEGYKLAVNGYVCDDVNECKIGNGGCEFGCGNTIGSYQCYCEQGHQLYNETHCESDIQCDVVDSSGYQENRFTCQGGFNLTITNLTCHSITEPTTPSTEQPTSCPIGYSLHNSGECKDFDECDEVTNCTYACQNTEGSYSCICEEGYKLAINGYDCEEANECQEWNGGCEFGCRNTIGSYLCYCEYGHQLINQTHCESDIQCDVVDSSGHQENRFTCQGGFNLTITNLTCQSITEPTTPSTEQPTSCPIGYSLHNSGECKDFNECTEVTNCSYACQNTEGSYNCICEEGYKLAINGYDCEDANECQEWNGGCEFGCRNTIGSYLCYCEYGHQLINQTHCESDIQCDVIDSSNNEEYQFICDGGFNLTITNFTCQSTAITMPKTSTAQSTIPPTFCPIGYSLHNSGECKDFDECNEATDCAYACENTEGSYRCACDEGYTVAANGYACDDINECQVGNGGCEFGCQNIIGSYLCYCQDGHQLINQTHCESNIQCDVVDSSGHEEHRFVCHGGFNLTITNLTCHGFPNPTIPSTTESTESPTNCPIGYSLHNSGECKDFDECDEETNCEHSCENSEGSYYCLCNEGYTVSTNGYDCEDTNECKEWNGGCEFGCRNTIGSFLCYCEYGHQLINETHCESNIQCDVVDGSGYQENRFICQGGFNLTITNLTCHSFPDPTSPSESTEPPTNCPIGYSLHNSGECKDFDECNHKTNCEHTCENTEGSYLCVCDEGYKLAANGYDCDDVNECQEVNGGCEFGCRNIIGSFECYCEYGHQLINETHCESNIQCDVVDSSYHENRFICQGGFNITIYNHSCPNVDALGNTTHQSSDPTSSFTQQVMSTQNQFEWYQPTVILMIISLVSNVFLIFMFIALFLYFVRKNNKMHRMLKAKDTNNHRIPRAGYSNEIYNYMHGSAQPDELRKTIAKESELIEKKDPNLIAEVYPGSVQDEAVRYQIN